MLGRFGLAGVGLGDLMPLARPELELEGGMRFCSEHWELLRSAIEGRGLGHLMVEDGELVVAQQADQFERAARGEEPLTAVNYDPLLAAYWQVLNYVGKRVGGAGLRYLVSVGPEDPVAGYGKRHEGRTWPRCPVCYLNLAHEVTCRDRRCKLDRRRGYDWTIPRAADDQAAYVEKLKESAGELG